jgi:Na+-driven multidrug efflux pump
VLVFPFGVRGAAIATILSQAMMTLFIILYGCRRYPELMPKRGFRADPSVLQAGARLGFPPMLQNSIVSLGNLILHKLLL